MIQPEQAPQGDDALHAQPQDDEYDPFEDVCLLSPDDLAKLEAEHKKSSVILLQSAEKDSKGRRSANATRILRDEFRFGKQAAEACRLSLNSCLLSCCRLQPAQCTCKQR